MPSVSLSEESVPLRTYFSSAIWFGTGMRGRILRRFCITFLLVIVSVATVTRIYSFVLTQRFQAVITGLSKLRIGETTEEELRRVVPNLVRSEWDWQVKRTPETGDVDLGSVSTYYVTISNEPSWMRFATFASQYSIVRYPNGGRPSGWLLSLANLLGYRYIGFGAGVRLLDGKVSKISFGVADYLVFPRPLGTMVWVESAHAFWAPYQRDFEVSSTDDENLQLRINANEEHLSVLYAFDAPPAVTSHAFHLDLSCFWGLLGCRHARQIAPLLWQDKITTETRTLARLKSNQPCPDRILAARVRYLPDVSVLLLESKGFKTENVNEEGMSIPEIWTNYKLIEVLRGRSWQPSQPIRSSPTVPYPGDYDRRLPNMGLQWAYKGQRVMLFSNLNFDSCRVVAATPSAESAVRATGLAPRRAEDQMPHGGLL